MASKTGQAITNDDARNAPTTERDLTPETPLLRAVRIILAQRLSYVADRIPEAMEPDGDIEYVHQLRVSTRRATAALDVFRDTVRPKRRRRLRRALKLIRRAAAGAREADVHIVMLSSLRERAQTEQRAAIDWLLDVLAARRRSVQPDMDAVLRRFRGRRFTKLQNKLMKRLHLPSGDDTACGDPGDLSLMDAARTVLPTKTATVRRTAQSDLNIVEHAHQLRIEAKMLRYALEVFSGVFEKPFQKDMSKAFKQLQDRLGAINDADEFVRTLRSVRQIEGRALRGGNGAEALLKTIDAMIDEWRVTSRRSHLEFLDWWPDCPVQAICDRIDVTLRVQENTSPRPVMIEGDAV